MTTSPLQQLSNKLKAITEETIQRADQDQIANSITELFELINKLRDYQVDRISKADRAAIILEEEFSLEEPHPRKFILQRLQTEAEMGAAYSSTYYQKWRKNYLNQES